MWRRAPPVELFTVRPFVFQHEEVYGARGRTRTGTGVIPRDFKSLASTNFATRASIKNVRKSVLEAGVGFEPA